jgi:hypothetical protein
MSLRSILILLALLASPALAGTGDPAPVHGARHALDLARDAARSWEPDAVLIYLENDEALDPAGQASRWGYLFYSPGRDQARGYSIQDDTIVAADFLPFDFEAPPLPETWIDSDAALAAAEKKTQEFREERGGRATTLLLVRSGFDEKHPDLTTWTVVYTAPGEPALFVLVDAATGDVKRMWRG